MPDPKGAKPPLPRCDRKKPTPQGTSVQCPNPGFHCYVHGEFGRTARVLCMGCIAALKGMGWTVRYAIEGDAPKTPDTTQGQA